MKYIYFTAGPSELYPTVPQHMQQAIEEQVPSMSHRGEAFGQLITQTIDELKELLSIPRENSVFFLSSANEAWEKIIENCVERQSFHFINGAFGKRFFQIAQELKKDAMSEEVPDGHGFHFQHVSIPQNIELVSLTHNESSTGVALDMDAIHSLKKRNPNKLFALDVVSSIPYVEVDFSLMDCVYFSVQKGFGLPAGLAVLVVSPAAIEKATSLYKKNINMGSYHNFLTLKKFADKKQTPETPNVLNIYLFNKVIQDFATKGLATIRQETDMKAQLLADFVEQNKQFSMFVEDSSLRSKTLAVLKTPTGSKDLIEKLKNKNFIVGKGYGPYKDDYIRIANFPAHSVQQVQQLISSIV